MSHPTCASSVASKDPIMEALPTPTSRTTIPNPNDGTITTNGVMVSPAVWKQFQNMLAMYPTPPTSTPITADLLPAAPTSGTSALAELSNLEEDEDSLPDTNIDRGEDKIPNDRVQATNPSSERDATPDLPPLITNLKSYDFTVGEPMDTPPITRFMTMDSLVCFCQMWAKTHGYTVSKVHSTTGKNVYILCDRSGKYQAKETKKAIEKRPAPRSTARLSSWA
ncbi:hypothetical protein MJO29_007200 [Puccinia striiformis f. sp. tritici]|nr:hypothetical protein MJO29_007200 [Puccinia striiformis f. sp. tritici]